MNSIDVVIPTLWLSESLISALTDYVNCDAIGSIFLIDNNHTNRPTDAILTHKKITIVSYGKNIYVNPAWNEGYTRSTANILCLLNDDITVESSIFSYMAALDFSEIDLVGVHLKMGKDNYHVAEHSDGIDRLFKLKVNRSMPIGGQAFAFGVCMFVKRSSYKSIPSLYQIWYGDDYLVQHCENVYVLKTSKISGEISKTIVELTKTKNSEVQKRIDQDSRNLYRYSNIVGVKDWDLAKNAVREQDLLKLEYKKAKTTPSDINENVHILYDLAKECDTVVEMGVRTGVSTRAFLASDVKLLSFDLVLDQTVKQLFGIAQKQGKHVQYIQGNVLDIEIEEADMLFIDTFHTYDQLSRELRQHGNKAKKYLVFHDTYTFGLQGESNNDNRGLLTAIIEFMVINPHWAFKLIKTNNNGLLVLERKQDD